MAKESLFREDTETIVLGPAQRKGYFVFAQPLVGDLAERIYEDVQDKIKAQYKGTAVFSQPFSFDKKSKMIKGSNPFFGVLADAALAENGLYLPSVREGKLMDSQKRLSNGVYRDYGMVVYNEKSPNENIATILAADANSKGMNLPVILPFRALSLMEGDNDYGIHFNVTDDVQGVIAGANAKKIITNMDYKATSGAHRLVRVSDGDWDAYWDCLALSGGGRVDFVCGEATREKLESALQSEISRKYASKRTALEEQLRALADEEQEFTTQAYKVFRQ